MRCILRNSFLGEPNRSSTNRSRRCHERDGKELSTDRCRTCIPINVLWPVNGIRDESSHHCWKPTRSSLRTASFLEFHKPRAVTISWYPCRCSSFARVFSDFPRPSVLESRPTVFKWPWRRISQLLEGSCLITRSDCSIAANTFHPLVNPHYLWKSTGFPETVQDSVVLQLSCGGMNTAREKKAPILRHITDSTCSSNVVRLEK